MIGRKTLTLVVAVGCALCLTLLLGNEQQPVAITEAALAVQPAETKADSSDESPTAEQLAEAPVVVEEEPVANQYELPFPDRINLFEAPKRQGKGIVKLDGQIETAIELLGFVNVDQQQVVLSVDGLVAALAEGSIQDGIEVISIQPPSVVLKRGKQRWQASLEN